jgi:hypothetical protein
MVKNHIHADGRNAARAGIVKEKLGLGIKCCEVALSSGSASTWERKN